MGKTDFFKPQKIIQLMFTITFVYNVFWKKSSWFFATFYNLLLSIGVSTKQISDPIVSVVRSIDKHTVKVGMEL